MLKSPEPSPVKIKVKPRNKDASIRIGASVTDYHVHLWTLGYFPDEI